MVRKASLAGQGKFHLNKPVFDKMIKEQARKNKSVIYGARAMNIQMHPFTRRGTIDYDIYAKQPRKAAKAIEKKIEKNLGYDLFDVKPALHPGTYKVVNKVTEEGYVDYTKKGRVPHKRINSNDYETLRSIKKGKKKILKDPESRFRHHKDKDDLRRMQASRRFKRKW